MARFIKTFLGFILFASAILIAAMLTLPSYVPSYLTKITKEQKISPFFISSVELKKENTFSGTFSITITKNLSTELDREISPSICPYTSPILSSKNPDATSISLICPYASPIRSSKNPNATSISLICPYTSPILFPKNPHATSIILNGTYSLNLAGITLTMNEEELPQLLSLKKWTTNISLIRQMITNIEGGEIRFNEGKIASISPYTLNIASSSFQLILPTVNLRNGFKIEEIIFSANGELENLLERGTINTQVKGLYSDTELLIKDFLVNSTFYVKNETFTQRHSVFFDFKSSIIRSYKPNILTKEPYITFFANNIVFNLPSDLLDPTKADASKVASITVANANNTTLSRIMMKIILEKGIFLDFGKIKIANSDEHEIIITSSIFLPANKDFSEKKIHSSDYEALIVKQLQAKLKLLVPTVIYDDLLENPKDPHGYFITENTNKILNIILKEGVLYANDKRFIPVYHPYWKYDHSYYKNKMPKSLDNQ